MSQTLSRMGYFLVMVFFARSSSAPSASRTSAHWSRSKVLALKSLALPPLVTLGGLIALTSVINLLVASASAKWPCWPRSSCRC